jgi:crotonobetainyl-CoA:carnitine CoA-transferase CaiB-like acyl-CoA transferase
LTKREAAAALSEAGLAVGPVHDAAELVADPHLAQRNMLVEMDRPTGDGPPVLAPGNPIKMSRVAEGPETRVPWVGEHTAEVLAQELGSTADELARLRKDGVIT